jgi:hypothetical protein
MLITLQRLEQLREEREDASTGASGDSDSLWSELRPALTQLESLLRARSFAARPLAEEIAGKMQGSALAKDFDEVQNGIQKLRYDSALEALMQMNTGRSQ